MNTTYTITHRSGGEWFTTLVEGYFAAGEFCERLEETGMADTIHAANPEGFVFASYTLCDQWK
jgi:hypothetical protein